MKMPFAILFLITTAVHAGNLHHNRISLAKKHIIKVAPRHSTIQLRTQSATRHALQTDRRLSLVEMKNSTSLNRFEMATSNSRLTYYNLEHDCNGDVECFIDKIPEYSPTKDDPLRFYSRLGDVFWGIENGDINLAETTCNNILTRPHLDAKFLPIYLRKMGWVRKNVNSGEPNFAVSNGKGVHDYPLAKRILQGMHGKYMSPTPYEVVIHIRASDKFASFNDGTCVRTSGMTCSQVHQIYPEYIFSNTKEIMSINPEVKHITIVTSKKGNSHLNSSALATQHQFFQDLLINLSTLSKSINLHTSEDLDEDLYYMGTSKYLVAMDAAGNLSALARKIQSSDDHV